MTSQNFNGESLPKYQNHVQVLKATGKISALAVTAGQPSMEDQMEMMFDPGKAQEFITEQKTVINNMITGLETIKKGVKNSDTLSEDVRDAFTTQILAQQGALSSKLPMMDFALAQMSGDDSLDETKVMQTIVEQQMASQNLVEKQKELFATLYGFKPGQTIADINTGSNMTIEDFERYNAMIGYSANTDELLQEVMPAVQTGDFSAIGEVVDLLDGMAAKMNAVKTAVSASTSMTEEQKEVCLKTTEITQNLYKLMGKGLSGMAEDNPEAVMEMGMALPQHIQNALPVQEKYFDVLDKHYQSKAAPTNDNTLGTQNRKKPGGPNNG